MKFPIVTGTLDSRDSFREFLTEYDKTKLKRPFVDFNLVVTHYKIYTINVLLSLLSIIEPNKITFYDECGHEVRGLRVKFVNREFFTRINGAVVWKMIGFEGSRPILTFKKGCLRCGLYFNRRIFVGTKTGFKDYLPSASIILRNWSISHSQFSTVPFSWGSDIVQKDFDERLLFILETALGRMPDFFRTYFQGFKYLEVKYKYLVSPRKLPKKEQKLIESNGFKFNDQIKTGVEFKKFISPKLQQYFRQQIQLHSLLKFSPKLRKTAPKNLSFLERQPNGKF